MYEDNMGIIESESRAGGEIATSKRFTGDSDL